MSRKIGALICKSALDSISLAFGGRHYFFKQALGDERLPSMRTDTLVETNGHLWIRGTQWGPRVAGGLVQAPCIERNAMGAIKAICISDSYAW